MLDETKLKAIDDYWRTHETCLEPSDDGYLWFIEGDEESTEIEAIFWEEIISGNHFDPEGTSILRANGYEVWAGDKDSFGILVACVAKDGKAFSFG